MKLSVPDYLRNEPEESLEVDALSRLEQLVESFQRLEGEVEELDLQLKDRKEALRQVAQEGIPNLLRQHGLSEVRLKDGKKVIVREQVSASVPADKEQRFFEFLAKRHEEDIVKLHFHFARMPEEQMQALFEFLTEREYAYDSERGVHPQTLKKYFKELLGLDLDEDTRAEGVANGRLLRKEDVTEVASVYTYFDTKIKES